MFQTIHTFSDFCRELRRAGFSMGGDNPEGIFTLNRYFGDQVQSHTGDRETDPWEWRIRGVTECGDLAYGKVFFKKGGWITKEWYPYFLAARRQGRSFSELYSDGVISPMEKKLYQIIASGSGLPLHDLKLLSDCSKEDASRFDTAVTGLQMKLLITISGETRKFSRSGEPYGWPVTIFSTVEQFLGEEIWEQSCRISRGDAVAAISVRVRELNPLAEEKKLLRFIG